MRRKKILCVLTTLLGNKATTSKLMEVLNRVEGVDCTFVLLGADDYLKYPAPRWARLTDAWEGRYVARKKSAPQLAEHFDLLFVNSWEFVVEFQAIARKIPAVALMDAVPVTVDAQLRSRGIQGWRRNVAHRIHNDSFRKASRHFRLFFPMGSDCRTALEREYGVRPEQCIVTLAPQDLDAWKPGGRFYKPPLQLLFVANDFVRKGGGFLLKLYQEQLSDIAQLTIASNDGAIERFQLPSGVRWLRGKSREELLAIYQASDLFLFPTAQDYMPQVLAEALATGLPCIARDVGGIGDLVRTGETGYLIEADAPPERWAQCVRSLYADPAALAKLSLGARCFAEAELSMERFAAKLNRAVRLLEAPGPTGR